MTVTDASFRLTGPTGEVIEPTTIQVKNNGLIVQLTYPPLGTGAHTIEIDAAAIADPAGNALSDTAGLIQTFSIEWIGTAGGSATNLANWSENRLPGPDDEAFVDLPAAQTVTFSAGNSMALASLTLLENSG